MLPDKIILSCDENPIYREFWEPVAWAYRKMFPSVGIHLAFLTNRTPEDPMIKAMEKFGVVWLFKPLNDIPPYAQAKMLRFILASEMADEVCYIDDIDLFPLRADFITSKLEKRPEGVLLCVGGEVYAHDGRYPVSQMTAEGWLWKKAINPNGLPYDQLMRTWKDKAFYDHRENINIWEPTEEYYFSDECLLKRLIFENPVPKIEIPRGYDNHLESTIDRQTYNKDTDIWDFDLQKLKDGVYVNAHCVRPYKKHEGKFAPLFAYINRNYGQETHQEYLEGNGAKV